MPMTKGKLSLLLLVVAMVAVLLSGCFLPQAEDKTPPVISVSTPISASAGQPFTVQVSASDKSGVEYIEATFMGQVASSTTSPASFTFMAPSGLVQPATYPLEIKAVDNSKNHNVAIKDVNVTVWPTHSGTITYSVQLNNANGLYMYPIGPQENGSVIFSVKVLAGADLVHSVNVFVDGQSIPSTSTASVLKASANATSTESEYTFFYPINEEHAGPHSYYAVFYGQNGQQIEKSASGWFYIIYQGTQNVELSAATPLHHGSYVTGDISFVATATDYTSNYEAFLVNGTPVETLVSYPSTDILNVESATKIVEKSYNFDVNTASLPDGTTTFVFKDISVDGAIKTATQSYVIDNTPPVLKASYKGIPSSGNTLYVGISPTTFNVYAYDANWMSSAATLGSNSFALTENGTALADVAGLSNGATEAFTAEVKDYADHEATLSLTIIRDTIPPAIHFANITGLSTVNGVPYSADATITVEASVTDENLKSVAFVLDGPNYTFPMTKNASGLWTVTVDLPASNVLPGTYHASIIATDKALNEATTSTNPATVNVYRPLTSVFTTSLETTPSAPVNGFVKSATITVNINPDWVYAVKKIYLYKDSTVSASTTGTGSATYYFTTFSGTGTYHVVVEDIVNATVTDGSTYAVNIDSASPSITTASLIATATSPSVTFTVNATDTQSGVSSFELYYQTLGGTGADNGDWVLADSVSGNMLNSAMLTLKNLNTLPDGKYNIKVVVTDGVGNTAEATGYVINNNAGNPDVTFTFPPLWTNSTSTVVNIGATVNNESDVTITATSGDASLIDFGSATTTSISYTAYPFTATWSATFTGTNATSLATITVKDEANHVVTATQVIGFDNTKPVATPTAPATVAGGATFTITVHATDNLSAIKSVTIGGVAATLTTTTSTNEFGVTNGTYEATFVAPMSSGLATYDIAVIDNAGNEATTSISVYVDVTAPNITVKFAGTGVTPAVTIESGATYTVYANSAATLTITATDDSNATVTLVATVGGWSTSKTEIVPTTISTPLGAATYSITAFASDEYGHSTSFDVATVTVVIDNTSPIATLSVPSTLNLANFDTAVATYTATDEHFYEATLTINGNALAVGQASPATIALNNSVFGLSSVNGTTVTATLTVVDKAGNVTTVSTQMYVDTVAPTMAVNPTIYKSGDYYYLDIQFSEPMSSPTSIASQDVKFVTQSGVTYYIDEASATFTPVNSNGVGFLHIWGLYTSAGATTNVLPLAGNTVTIYMNATKFTDTVGNKLANSPYTVKFTPYSAPSPVNP